MLEYTPQSTSLRGWDIEQVDAVWCVWLWIDRPAQAGTIRYLSRGQALSESSRNSLINVFFGGYDINISYNVRIIADGKKGDIISQFIQFCKVFDEQINIHGKHSLKVKETLQIYHNYNGPE